MTHGLTRPRAFALALTLALSALTAAAAPADAAKKRGKPNLIVSSISEAPASLGEGASFTAVESTRNAGGGAAGRSTVRYYLTTDAKRSLSERRESKANPRTSPGDILLTGVRELDALGAGRTSVGRKVKLAVPLGTPAGSYQLLACADDRGVVGESREDDNCRFAKRQRVLAPSGGLRVDAFSDTVFPTEEEDVQREVDFIKTLYCTPAKAKPLTLKAALANLRKKLPKAGWSAFAKSGSYKKASLAEQAAGSAILRDSPGAALAALVRAHELEPREASHLANAAGVATAVGYPAEALALADAAAVRDDRDATPMGLSRQALTLTNRGNALVQLGRFGEAQDSLEAALGIEPLLSEAASGLTAANGCSGANPIPAFRRAEKRQPERDPEEGPEDESKEDEEAVDVTQGKEHKLRDFQWPASPQQAPAFVEYVKEFEKRESRALQRRVARRTELESQLRAEKDVLGLERERRDELITFAHTVTDTKKTRELQRRFFEAVDRSYEPLRRIFVDGNAPRLYHGWQDEAFEVCGESEEDWDVCMPREMQARCVGPTNGGHQEWLDRISEAHRIGTEYHRERSRLASAVAAQMKDERAREIVKLFIEGEEASTLALMTQSAGGWTGNVSQPQNSTGVHYCISDPIPTPTEDPGETPGAQANPCEGDVKSINLLWKVGPVTLKASCEELALEGSTEGFIQAFGEIKYDYRGNKITVFGGAKGEIAPIPGVKADFKSGVYVQVGDDGIQDVGWRVGPSYTVGDGPAEFNPSDTIDMSFVGALGGAQ